MKEEPPAEGRKQLDISRLMRRSRLASNVLWNLVGLGAPMLVGAFAIPVLIHHLGAGRFGLLAIAWVVIGYSNIFDLGLGRALTHAIAQKLGERCEGHVPAVIWSALLVMLGVGLIGAIVLGLISPVLVDRVLKIPFELKTEALQTFELIAISIPIVVTTAGLRGILEAYQRFDLLNAIRVPHGIVTYLGPVVLLPLSHSLPAVVLVLLVCRLLAWLAHLVMCLQVVPALRHDIKLQRKTVIRLLRFGTWMTVSNLLAPLMVSLDRFVLGAVLSVAAVAYYATPYELVTRLWLVPSALAGVLFPLFGSLAMQDQPSASRLLTQGVKYTFAVLFPAVLLIVSFAHQLLSAWVDTDFAAHSAPVLRVLAVGVLINSLAYVPLALLQGFGRPDLTARAHLGELPLYLILLWVLLHTVGIVGVALAWLTRVSVDAVVLFLLSWYFARFGRRTILRGALIVFPFLSVLPIVGFLSNWVSWLVTSLALVAFLATSWRFVVSPLVPSTATNRLRLMASK